MQKIMELENGKMKNPNSENGKMEISDVGELLAAVFIEIITTSMGIYIWWQMKVPAHCK